MSLLSKLCSIHAFFGMSGSFATLLSHSAGLSSSFIISDDESNLNRLGLEREMVCICYCLYVLLFFQKVVCDKIAPEGGVGSSIPTK